MRGNKFSQACPLPCSFRNKGCKISPEFFFFQNKTKGVKLSKLDRRTMIRMFSRNVKLFQVGRATSFLGSRMW